MPVEFKHTTLDNGLTIVAEVNPNAHTAATGFFVKAGSRDEVTELMGVSHFLEHMMFKGTERRTAAEVNRDFDRIGANYNASTSQEVTNYYAHVLPEYLGDALDLLTDILRPTLRGDDFDMEKNVILEEIGMYEDRPFWVAYEEVMDRYFGPHPLGHRVLGTNDSITKLTRDQMMGYFNTRYSPNNMVASLAGRVDFDRCVDQIAKATESWTPAEVSRNYRPPQPVISDHHLTRSSTNMRYLVALTDAPSAQDDRRYAAAVLANVLGDSDGSRLYWKLIDPGIADEAELSHHSFDQTGVNLMYLSCSPNQAERAETIFDEVLTGAGDNLTAEEVERATRKMAMDLTLQNERPAGRMMALGAQWLYLNKYLPLADELQRLTAVSVDDLQSLLTAYPLSPRAAVRLSPAAASTSAQ